MNNSYSFFCNRREDKWILQFGTAKKLSLFAILEGFFISYSGRHLQHKTCVPILHLLPSCKIATCCTNGMSGSTVREESDLKCITRFSTGCTTQLIVPEAIKHNRSSVQYSLLMRLSAKCYWEPTCEGGDGAVARGGRRWRGWVGALGPKGRPPPPSGLTTFCRPLPFMPPPFEDELMG